MVTEVKQSKYTMESNMLRRLYDGGHFSIISTHQYINGSVIQLFSPKLSFKIIHQVEKNNHQFTAIYKNRTHFVFHDKHDYVIILTFFHNMLKNKLWQANKIWL